MYIKCIHNSVADAISRLEYTPTKEIAGHFAFMQSLAADFDSDVEQHVKWKTFSHFHNSCEISCDTVGVTTEERHLFLNSCFASCRKEEQEEICPPTIPEIANAQHADENLRRYFKRGGASSTDRYKVSIIED